MSKLLGYVWGNREDHPARVAPFSNLYTVAPQSLTESLDAILTKVMLLDMMSMVAIGPIVANPANGRLLRDWHSRLDQWADAQGNAINERVAAFYLPDEPYHLGWTPDQITRVSDRLHVLFPDRGQVLVEGYQTVRSLGTSAKPIPQHVNVVGWDRYGTLSPHLDGEYNEDYYALASRLGGRKMVIVGECQWCDYYTSAGLTPAVMSSVADSYHTVAKRAEVLMLLMYLLPDAFDSPDHVGLFRLPAAVQARHAALGKAFAGK
jgi:hypothetical protein